MLHEQESVGRTQKMFGSSYKNGNKGHFKQRSYCYIWAISPLSFCEYVSYFIMLNIIIYCLELFVVQKLHVLIRFLIFTQENGGIERTQNISEIVKWSLNAWMFGRTCLWVEISKLISPACLLVTTSY